MREEYQDLLRDFIKAKCYKKIIEAIKSDKSCFELDFKELEKLSPELAYYSLDNFSDFSDTTIKLIKDMSLPIKNKAPLEPKIIKLPESHNLEIGNVRITQRGKLKCLKGKIKDVNPLSLRCEFLVYECSSCGTRIDVEQKDANPIKPLRCENCGQTKRFKEFDKKLIDSQIIIIEEPQTEETIGRMQNSIKVILEKDLVDPEHSYIIQKDKEICVLGVVDVIDTDIITGKKLKSSEYIIFANNIFAT